jgi:hypothetical protein
MEIYVCWYITPFELVNCHRLVTWSYFLHLQIFCLTLNMIVLHHFAMSVNIDHSTRSTLPMAWVVISASTRTRNFSRRLTSRPGWDANIVNVAPHIMYTSAMIVLLGSTKKIWPQTACYLYIEFPHISQLTCAILFYWLRKWTGELSAVPTGAFTSLDRPVYPYVARCFDSRARFDISWRNGNIYTPYPWPTRFKCVPTCVSGGVWGNIWGSPLRV